MSKRKWYTKAIYLAVALALVAGLTLVAAPQSSSEVVADPGTIDSYRARLISAGDGYAKWVTTPLRTGGGSYSLDLNDGTQEGASAGRIYIQFLPPPEPRQALEADNPKPGVPPAAGFPLADLDSASDIDFWVYTSDTEPEPYVNLYLYVPKGDSGNASYESIFDGFSQWDEGLGFPLHKWNLHVMEGLGSVPTDGTETTDAWETWEPMDDWYSSDGDESGWSAEGFGNCKTLAQWQTQYPCAIVVGMSITKGYTAGSTGVSAYIDDVSVTHDTVEDTYVMEPQIDKLMPDVALDVKGAVQKFVVNSIDPTWVQGWEISAVVNLEASDITVIDGGEPAWSIMGGSSGGTGATGEDWIAIRSLVRGDCHIVAEIHWNDDETDVRYVWGEKKWGEISKSELDINLDVDGVQHERTITCELDGEGEIVVEQEWIEETVWADFYWGSVEDIREYTAGHALVHWWAMNDTAANQDVIHDLMDDLDPVNDGWSACGKYDPDFAPFDILDALATAEHLPSAVAWWKQEAQEVSGDCVFTPVGAPVWYTQTETEDDWPGELRGHTWAHLGVKLAEDPADSGIYPDVDVIIVTLAEYPHDYSGENAVSVQMGKKHYSIEIPPPPEQIKAPQVRWAGEKIVLEKEWGVEGNTVVFALQEGSVGSLEAIYAADISDSDAQTVITSVQLDGVARCILQSQPQGQADVKAALYAGTQAGGDSFPEAMGALDGIVVSGNHDFLVYFLALEDVSVDEGLSDLTAIDAGVDADVLVKVRGWFTRDDLQSDRLARDVDGDGLYELPAGRIVLPDDWAALAGSDEATSNKASRPQYDLMNTPDGTVVSDPLLEWGDYDGGVRTTTPPGEAEYPTIGPFNPLQPWSNFDTLGNPVNRWIATASVPADDEVCLAGTGCLRNTVVPDTTIDWYDCPMPQALVTFDVDDTEVLSALDKGDVFFSGTGAAKVYTAPFYAVEIPSHWLIPVAGYFWDSWGLTVDTTIDGPYDFWDDLGVTPSATDNDILEVYSDNHGYAGVTIVGTGLADECVTLDVIADFPVMAAKYIAVDTDIGVCWGIAVEHLNADFEVSDRTGEATTDVPLTISFYGLKAEGTGAPWTTGGTQPYVKAEWDFDGDGTIDETIVGATSALTLVTQTFEFTAANSYSPWLRVTDTNGLVDICEKPNYIVLTGEAPPAEFPLCDIDESGTVDIEDFVVFAASYGSNPGDANWDARCDLNEVDGVDILDFIIFAQCYVAEA